MKVGVIIPENIFSDGISLVFHFLNCYFNSAVKKVASFFLLAFPNQ